MMDVMYFGSEHEGNSLGFQSDFIKQITEKFPNVKLKDAYDYIKGLRQEVHLDESDKDNYFSFLIGKGWYEMSLTMQIAMMDKDQVDECKRWLKLAKTQYPEAFKPES